MPQSGETIPPVLHPPLEVVLAKAVKGVPPPAALPGQVLFEPKFEGYRILIFRDRDRVSLWSRQGKELTRVSVGVKRRCEDPWPSESAVVSARQVSLTSLFSVPASP